MGKKFDVIYESVVSRYEVGAGYLPGDIVKFRSNYKSCAAYKAMSTDMQREIDDLAGCKLNIMVVQVGDKFSGASGGNQFKTADNAVITIAADQGGGRNYGRVTVSPEMIDLVSSDKTNLPPIPDEWRRKDNVNIKPKPVEDFSDADNRKTDKGNGKNTPTSLKLAGESNSWASSKELAVIYENMTPSHLMTDEKAAALIFDKIMGIPNLSVPVIKSYVKRYLPMVGKNESDIDFLTANVYDMLSDKGLIDV